jgi:uncharacterized protein YkwD
MHLKCPSHHLTQSRQCADKLCMDNSALRRLMLVLGAALVVLAVAGSPAVGAVARSSQACEYTTTPVTAATRAEVRSAVVCLIDQQRVEHGLPAVASNADLSRSAQDWTQTMVHSGEFTHGADFAARITAAGLKWSSAGENIATGFVTPAQVVAAWMASLGHCQNILNPGFSQVGIGVVSRPVANYATEAATWTADFALPMGSAPPSRNLAPMNGCPYRS